MFYVTYETLENYEKERKALEEGEPCEVLSEMIYLDEKDLKAEEVTKIAERYENGVIAAGFDNCADYREIIRKNGNTISDKRRL